MEHSAKLHVPLANKVVFLKKEQQTEEEEVDTKWLKLVISMVHIQTSRCACKRVNANALIHLGHVMADLCQGYKGFL